MKFRSYLKYVIFTVFIGLFAVSTSSCSNKSYPCPGLGQSDAADLSMFGDDGELKENKKGGRINKSTGTVNKKNPKRIRRKRKNKL